MFYLYSNLILSMFKELKSEFVIFLARQGKVLAYFRCTAFIDKIRQDFVTIS